MELADVDIVVLRVVETNAKSVKTNIIPQSHSYRLCLQLMSTVVQGRNHVFKVEGPIPWSRVQLPFYRKK